MEVEERIFQALKAGLGAETNVSDRTIRAYAKRIATKLTDESQIDVEVLSDIEVLKEISGNISAEAKKAAEGKVPAPKPEEPKKEIPDVAKMIADSLAPIAEQLKQFGESRKAESAAQAEKARLENVRRLLKEQGANDEPVLDITLKLNQYDSKLSAEDVAKVAISDYNQQMKNIRGEAFIPQTPEAGKAQNEAAKRATDGILDKALGGMGVTAKEKS